MAPLYPNEDHPEEGPPPRDGRAEKRALIGLSLVPGVGPGLLRALLARFGSAVEVRHAPERRLTQTPGVGPKTAKAIRQFDGADAVDEQLHRAERVGATLIAAWDERFPRRLRHIYDPPALFWVRGRLTPQDRERAVAIVGTRRCSDYGRRLAQRFAGALARHGCTVVSGLAYGIDRAAHEGALEAGGRTLAVFGTGIDRVYPAKHKRLARRIAEDGGALLSEFPLGAGPDRGHFPARNRVVSGLSAGVLVVESHERGGALITARQAVAQNREVFAVPGALTNKASAGTNRLIQRGHAKLVMEPEDLLEELNLPVLSEEESAEASGPDAAPAVELDGPEQALYEQIDTDPIHIDALCQAADLDPSTALPHLLSLEFKGLVRQMAGKQFYKA